MRNDQIENLGEAFPSAMHSIRARRGLSQVAFGKLIDFPQNKISEFECGRRQPWVRLLMRLLRLAETEDERGPIVAALKRYDILPSDLASSLLAANPSTEIGVQHSREGCNV